MPYDIIVTNGLSCFGIDEETPNASVLQIFPGTKDAL